MQYGGIVITLGACLAKLLRTAFERRRAIRKRDASGLTDEPPSSTGISQVLLSSVESCIRLFRCADCATPSPYTLWTFGVTKELLRELPATDSSGRCVAQDPYAVCTSVTSSHLSVVQTCSKWYSQWVHREYTIATSTVLTFVLTTEFSLLLRNATFLPGFLC